MTRKGSSRKKTAAGRQAKNTSSKKRVKSNARQEGSTLGPNSLSLKGKHVNEAIVYLVDDGVKVSDSLSCVGIRYKYIKEYRPPITIAFL